MKLHPEDLNKIDLVKNTLSHYGLFNDKNYIISGGSVEQRRDLMRRLISVHEIANQPRSLEVIPVRVVYAMWLLKNVIGYEPNRNFGTIEVVNSGIVDPQGDLSKISKRFEEDLISHSIDQLRERWSNSDVWLEEYGSENIEPYGQVTYDKDYFSRNNPFGIDHKKGMYAFITTPLTIEQLEENHFKIDDRFKTIEINESFEKFDKI